MRQMLLQVVLVVVVLSGCAGGTNDSGRAAAPDDVHAQWVQAVRTNDRQTALTLVPADMTMRDVFVDQSLSQMQAYMTLDTSPTGPLQDVSIQSLTDRGQGRRGVSVWTFEKKTWCYETILVQTDQGWKVTEWGQTGRCA